MRRPVSFCSMMCAAQPAVLAQVNIDGVISAGTCAKSSTIAAQNSTFVPSTRSSLRDRSSASAAFSSASATSYLGAPSSLAGRRSTRARGSSARYTRWPKPISRSCRSRTDFTYACASPVRSTSSIMCSTRAGAPPCSGPDSADRAGHRRRDIGAGRGDHPGGKGGGVHAVLGGARPVGVERLHMRGVWFAAPAPEEGLGRGLRPVDQVLRDLGQIGTASRLRDEGEHRGADPADVLVRLLGADVVQLSLIHISEPTRLGMISYAVFC